MSTQINGYEKKLFSVSQQQLLNLVSYGNLSQLNVFLRETDLEQLKHPEVIEELLQNLYSQGGQVSSPVLAEIPDIDVNVVNAELISRGYINEEGCVQQEFCNLMINSCGNKRKAVEDMILSEKLSAHREQIFEALESNIDYKVRAFSSYVLAKLSEAKLKVGHLTFLSCDPSILLETLKGKYLSKEGVPTNAFKTLKTYEDLDLPEEYGPFKRDIFLRIKEIIKNSSLSPEIYSRWSDSIDKVENVAVAALDKMATQCDSVIKIMGTYYDEKDSYGIDYAIKLKNDGIKTPQIIRPLDERYDIVDGVVRVTLQDPNTHEKIEVVAGAGESVALPRGQIVQFASIGPTTLKMLVTTTPSFESVNPEDFIFPNF